jgi:AraC-like DNA-binding protein
MPATAIALPDSDVPAQQPAKRYRMSKRMKQALASLATKGMTQREAARQAGISEFHLSRELKKPQIQAFIARKCRESMQTGVLRASARLVELIDANSEHVAAQVSERILTSEGILKSDQGSNIAVNVDIRAGYVIKLNGQAPALKSGADVEIDGSSS